MVKNMASVIVLVGGIRKKISKERRKVDR